MNRTRFLKTLGLGVIAAVVAPFLTNRNEAQPTDFGYPTDCKWIKEGDIVEIDGIDYEVHNYDGRMFYLKLWEESAPSKPLKPSGLYRLFKP